MLKNLKLWKKILLVFTVLLLLAILGFVIWANMSMKAESVALNKFLESSKDSLVIKENSSYWEISPKNCTPETCSRGVIFYPGAKVDPQVYFYKLGFLAQDQKLFITKPPLNLAFFNINQADDVINANPEIQSWTIGGHSLGGAMACEYTRTHAYKVTSLILIGSYCNSDISWTSTKVVSIHGELDGVLTAVKLQENAKNLPKNYVDKPITGMNHAQAGNYGEQSGDTKATKSDEEVKIEIEDILKNEL
jgi:Alpha/beta hydrolase family